MTKIKAMKVYFDNAATTPLAKEALDEMMPFLTENFGNPSSIHSYGRKSRAAIEKARKIVAAAINASTAEVFFTSCGTESNNMVIKQSVKKLGVSRIISSPIEHHCVLHSVETEAHEGIKTEMVKITGHGEVDYGHLEALLRASDDKTLVSLMHSNNEIGTLLDLERVSALCEAHGAYFHTDSVQTIGYYPMDVQKLKIHFLSGSGHKFHGPKGIGFVYISGAAMLSPFIDGGAQERNMRAGTENLYGIVGLGKALDMAVTDMAANRAHIDGLRQYMKSRLDNELSDVTYNGFTDDRGHYKVLNVSLPLNNKTDLIVFNLDIAGIAASAGSACTSGSEVGSHVLAGIHAPTDRKAVRFSFSKHNTKEEVDYVVEELKKMVPAKELVGAK
jgi:cysteine desulfurase